MGSRVSISRKMAQALLDICTSSPLASAQLVAGLSIALVPRAKKPFVTAPTRKAAKRKKRAEKNNETEAIYQFVNARADGRCECGCGTIFMDGTLSWKREMDHFFHKAKVRQNERNCWMLAADCHRQKHRDASPAEWLEKFVVHCERHGYSEEAGMATRLLGKHEVRAELSRGAP